VLATSYRRQRSSSHTLSEPRAGAGHTRLLAAVTKADDKPSGVLDG
jgi:hypothetical protein